MARIPTLDGWRGIAILLVIATHFQSGIIGHPIVGLPWMNLGQHGVGIFFVLSGYLITTQLLQDEKINLKRFYLRRFFRLMPCAWTYLLFVEILALILGTHLIGKDAWSCLFFFRNYYPALETGSNTLTGHFWSLSLEEQFYLVWPSLLVIVRRRWALPLASAGVTSCTIFRLFHWQQYETALLYLRTEVRADALLVGCILALLLERRAIKEWIERYGKFAFWLCIPPLAWDVYHYQLLIPLSESILFAIMIACTSQNPNSAPSRVLEWQHLKFTGLMSYSHPLSRRRGRAKACTLHSRSNFQMQMPSAKNRISRDFADFVERFFAYLCGEDVYLYICERPAASRAFGPFTRTVDEAIDEDPPAKCNSRTDGPVAGGQSG